MNVRPVYQPIYLFKFPNNLYGELFNYLVECRDTLEGNYWRAKAHCSSKGKFINSDGFKKYQPFVDYEIDDPHNSQTLVRIGMMNKYTLHASFVITPKDWTHASIITELMAPVKLNFKYRGKTGPFDKQYTLMPYEGKKITVCLFDYTPNGYILQIFVNQFKKVNNSVSF